MSNVNGSYDSTDKLYPCIGSCALSINGKECAIKIIAQSQLAQLQSNSEDK